MKKNLIIAAVLALLGLTVVMSYATGVLPDAMQNQCPGIICID